MGRGGIGTCAEDKERRGLRLRLRGEDGAVSRIGGDFDLHRPRGQVRRRQDIELRGANVVNIGVLTIQRNADPDLTAWRICR